MRVRGLHGWFPYFIHATQNPMRKKMNTVVNMIPPCGRIPLMAYDDAGLL